MQFLKNIWSSWKVQISFVSGCLVVATSFGTCTVDPNEEAIKEKVLEEVKEEPAKEEAEPEKAEEVPEKVAEPKEED